MKVRTLAAAVGVVSYGPNAGCVGGPNYSTRIDTAPILSFILSVLN